MPMLLIHDRSLWKSIAPFLYLIKRQKMKQILAFFIAIMLFLEATGQPQQQLTTQLTKDEYLKMLDDFEVVYDDKYMFDFFE